MILDFEEFKIVVSRVNISVRVCSTKQQFLSEKAVQMEISLCIWNMEEMKIIQFWEKHGMS